MLAGSAPLLLIVLAACCGAGAPNSPPERHSSISVQLALYHLHDEHVQVRVNGRIVFDRNVTVPRDNARLGLAAVAQIELPTCAEVVVTTQRTQVVKRICPTSQTRSVIVDGGPPLTIAVGDHPQGMD